MPEQAAARIIAFDFGLRRIGVAVGNELLGSATALAPLRAQDGVPDWTLVQNLLSEWNPDRVLVGLPLNMDGTPSEMSARAERFARRIHGRFGKPCEMVDERLSSVEARTLLRQGRRAGDASLAAVDSEAARMLVEAWFAERARQA